MMRAVFFLNDVDMAEMAETEKNDVSFLCGLANCLKEYQSFVWNKGGKDRSYFNAKVSALQDKIQRRVVHVYENMSGGVSCELDEDELWLNNIGVKKTFGVIL